MDFSSVTCLQGFRPPLMRLIAVFLAFAATGLARAQAAETVLYRFKDGSDGALPSAGLIFDARGALYGTTAVGGTLNRGTVFKLTPPSLGLQTQWTETVLYRFKGGSDGAGPYAGLILDARGALYGTTQAGGTSDRGTVFKLD